MGIIKLILTSLLATFSCAQMYQYNNWAYRYPNYRPNEYHYVRNSLSAPQASMPLYYEGRNPANAQQSRIFVDFFISTQSFTLTTSTRLTIQSFLKIKPNLNDNFYYCSTITTTFLTTCTTSAGPISVCSPVGGRRRRNSIESKLFYAEGSEDVGEEIFVNSPANKYMT